MQGRRAIEQHRMPLGHLIENIPDLGGLALDHLFRAAHRVHIAKVFKPANNERLEKNQRHLLWQTALMKFQLWADDNNRASRVVDTLAEQVLAETSPLALEHVTERLERPIASAGDSATVPAIVEQSVHRFLQHSLFVANDDVRRLEQKQILKPVVTINNPTVKIVQVRGRKTPALKRNERTQIRRDDRQHIENHPFGPGV